MRTRFESAQRVSKVRLLHNLSYASRKIVGNGWLLVGDANFFVDPFLSSGVQVAFKTAELAAIAFDKYLQSKDLQPLKDYEKWCQRYKFHVFVTMRLFYRLMKYQFAIQTFINAVNRSLQTKPNRLERGFIAWALGNFDRYYCSLYSIWIVFWALIIVSKIRHILFRESCW